MRTIIRDSQNLKKTLKEGSWDKIIFWEEEKSNQFEITWTIVSSGYAGEQDGNNPDMSISRSNYYNLTGKEIETLLKNIRYGHPSLCSF